MSVAPDPRARVLAAIDTADLDKATALSAALASEVGGIKLGKEFFTRHGPAGLRKVVGDLPLFLDLKFHDIPNTVAGAVRAAAALHPLMMNLHASGGRSMMEAAVSALREAARDRGGSRPLLLAVTVLTSLDEADLESVGQRGPVEEQVLRLAQLAQASGLDGAVCGATEITRLREACGEDFVLVVPGVRPSWAAGDDQKRSMTPREALERGADFLVVGRPITAAADPVAAARRLVSELTESAK
jgi:orotidine-5'-phosphate decarboxylase